MSNDILWEEWEMHTSTGYVSWHQGSTFWMEGVMHEMVTNK